MIQKNYQTKTTAMKVTLERPITLMKTLSYACSSTPLCLKEMTSSVLQGTMDACSNVA